MLQSRQIQPKVRLIQTQQQSLRLNRLLKFIQNKKSPSFQKLKHILLKNDVHSDRSTAQNTIDTNSPPVQNSQRQTVVINTKSIFVANNKKQIKSHRTIDAINDSEKNFYKVFITKQTIKFLYKKDDQPLVRQPSNSKLYTKDTKESKKQKTQFPPLIMPKPKSRIMFRKYQDETTQWLNNQLINLKGLASATQQVNPNQQHQQKQSKKANLKTLQASRQRYSKSLQKIVKKALDRKNMQRNESSKFILVKEAIQDSDDNVLKKTQEGQQDNPYANKGKLLTNPNLKLKRNLKMKSQKKRTLQKQLFTKKCHPKSRFTNSVDKQEQNNKKLLFETNTNISEDYLQSSFKLKTQISSRFQELDPNSKSNHIKTLKIIKELEENIKKSNQNILEKAKIIISKKYLKLNDMPQFETFNQDLSQSPKNIQKPKKVKNKNSKKTKTLQTEPKAEVNKKTITKWQISGYDFVQSPEDLHGNFQIQNYVQKINKKPKISIKTEKKRNSPQKVDKMITLKSYS